MLIFNLNPHFRAQMLVGRTLLCYFCSMKVFLRDDIQQIGPEQIGPLLSRLPQWRLEKALRFKHLSGQRECATAYLLLADALQTEYGITEVPPFAYTEHGKPYLPDYPHLHFNLSHCSHAVLCALDDQPIGADVESIRAARPGLLRYTMSEAEQALITSSPQPDRTFTTLWTRKEALLKLTGEGVGSEMHHILLPQRLADAGIQIHTTICQDYIYSVATRQR